MQSHRHEKSSRRAYQSRINNFIYAFSGFPIIEIPLGFCQLIGGQYSQALRSRLVIPSDGKAIPNVCANKISPRPVAFVIKDIAYTLLVFGNAQVSRKNSCVE